MEKPILIILLTLRFTFSLSGQPAIQWQICVGGTAYDQANSIQQTNDGGYIVTGLTHSNDSDVSGNHGSRDILVVKLSSIGILQWQKCLGGMEYESANSIRQTFDGGYILAGYSASNDGDVTGHHGGGDYWVVKLNSFGDLEWQKCYGGTDFDEAYSIQQTTDSGFIVAGYTWSNDGDVTGYHGNWDSWVLKLSPEGALQWQKCFGGSNPEAAYSIRETLDGGYIVAGYTESNNGNVTGNHGGTGDQWVVKLNSSGILQWQKCLGGTGQDVAASVVETSDTNYIVAGYTRSSDGDVSGYHGYFDCWIIKLNSSGFILWQKCLGGTGDEWASSIQQLSDGSFIIGGQTFSTDGDVSGKHGSYDSWVVKLDTGRNIVWQKCFGGTHSERTNSIQQTADGGYIFAGYTWSNDGDVSGNHGDRDFWILKLSSGIGIEEIRNPVYDLQIKPNPFSHSTIISFSLSRVENISINIYELTGRLVTKLFDGKLNSGIHELKWNLKEEVNVTDGIYFVCIFGDRYLSSSRIVVLK